MIEVQGLKHIKNIGKHGNRSSMDKKLMFALQPITWLRKSVYIASEGWVFTLVKERPKGK